MSIKSTANQNDNRAIYERRLLVGENGENHTFEVPGNPELDLWVFRLLLNPDEDYSTEYIESSNKTVITLIDPKKHENEFVRVKCYYENGIPKKGSKSCAHEYTQYNGFFDSFEYCKKCDHKKR